MRHGLSFHHPVAFWLGCFAVVAGVLAHMPMFWMGRYTDWQMVGMPMDATMWSGMVMIPVGLALSAFGLMPRLAQMRQTLHGDTQAVHFHVADGIAAQPRALEAGVGAGGRRLRWT